MLSVFPKLLLSGTFWLLTLVILVLSLIPGYFIRIYELYRANRILRKNEETPDTVDFVNSDNETATSYQLQVITRSNIMYIYIFKIRFNKKLLKSEGKKHLQENNFLLFVG